MFIPIPPRERALETSSRTSLLCKFVMQTVFWGEGALTDGAGEALREGRVVVIILV